MHEYHNNKSKYFSGDYPRMTFEERIENYKQNSKYGEYRIELLVESETDDILGFCIAYSKKEQVGRLKFYSLMKNTEETDLV